MTTDKSVAVKYWFFRHYWWFLPVVFGIAFGATMLISDSIGLRSFWGALGTFVSLVYFVQKQRLEEMRLFREIFADCNARYSKLNDVLNGIVDGRNDKDLADDEVKKKVMDYFNLCAEEYLYYREGYLLPVVWKSWFAGMRFFASNPRIRELLTKEMKQADSYYGLPFSDLLQAAEAKGKERGHGSTCSPTVLATPFPQPPNTARRG